MFTHSFSFSIKQMLEVSGAFCIISNYRRGGGKQGNGDYGVQERYVVKGHRWPQEMAPVCWFVAMGLSGVTMSTAV